MKIAIPLNDLNVIQNLGEEHYKTTASPYLETDEYEPVWSEERANKKWVERFLKSATQIGEWEGEVVWHYQKLNSDNAYYFILRDGLVIYGVRYKVEDAVGLKALCQTSVWRNRDVPLTVSVASWIFFTRLLPKFGAVISDKAQSRDGKTFWLNRTAEALRRGMFVYLVDLHQNTLSNVEVVDLRSTEWSKKVWSTVDKNYQFRRLLIVTTSL